MSYIGCSVSMNLVFLSNWQNGKGFLYSVSSIETFLIRFFLVINHVFSNRRELDNFIKRIQKRVGKYPPILDVSEEITTRKTLERETVSEELEKLIGRAGDDEIMNYDIDDAVLRNDFS